MFDPLRAKGQLIVTVAVGFMGGLTVASAMGWTGPSYAMPAITMAPQVTDEAVRPAMDLSNAFANTAASVTPAVVRIEVIGTRTTRARSQQIPEEFRRFFEIPDDQGPGETRETPTFGGGSGFLISEDGYILTNDHVVRKEEEERGVQRVATLGGTTVLGPELPIRRYLYVDNLGYLGTERG